MYTPFTRQLVRGTGRSTLYRARPKPLRSAPDSLLVVAIALSFVASCGPSGDAIEGSAGFDRTFAAVDTFELQEPPDRPLAEIRAFSEAANGDLLIAERWSSRVLRYDSAGNLLAEFGTPGEGPFEFRGVDGILESTDGDVIVFDRQLSRITVLDAELRPDTQFTFFPTPTGEASRLGRGYVLSTSPGPRKSGITWVSDEWAPVWSVPSPGPTSIVARPYWGGYGTNEFVTSPKFLVVGYSLLYPLYVYRPPGMLVDTIGRPRTFRVAPVVEAGAFAGSSGPDRRDDWFQSFDVIANLAVVGGSLLVVTHGALHGSTSAGRTWTKHRRIDVYSLNTRRKLQEDVALPDGSRVLGGGERGLYVLAAVPPAPWTIMRVRLEKAGDAGP